MDEPVLQQQALGCEGAAHGRSHLSLFGTAHDSAYKSGSMGYLPSSVKTLLQRSPPRSALAGERVGERRWQDYSACGMDAMEPRCRMHRALPRILYVLAAGGTGSGSLAGGSVEDSARSRSQRSEAASQWAASSRNCTA